MKRIETKIIITLFVCLTIIAMSLCGCGKLNEQAESVTAVVAETEIAMETTELVEEAVQPTAEPTLEPTVEPTPQPTAEPTPQPSAFDIVSEQLGLSVDYIEIDLPEVNSAYEILFVNDMHILTIDDSLVESAREDLQNRQENMFKTKTGIHSADAWLQLSSILDDFSSDYIIFGGDIIDFASEANIQILKEGLSKISTPYTYLRADHDLETWYSGGTLSAEDALIMHTNICNYEDVFILEYPEFYIIGWNNSTSQLSDGAMQRILSIWNNGKPILLATHVPINSIIDNNLAEAASNVDPEGRKKLWGDGCLYQPFENTSLFLGMIYDENSPVKAVFGGHLHFKHTIQLTNQTTEYVLAPAFAGKIAKITIK